MVMTCSFRVVEAKRALSRDEQQSSKDGIFSASRSFGSGESTRTKKIFVGGLPSNIEEEGFRHYFEAYGTVTNVAIIYDQQTNRPRGFGFISFDSEDAVDSVLHKTFYDLNGKQVEVKPALPKDANPGGIGRSIGGGTGRRGSYQGYGPPAGNSSSYDGRMDSNRYMKSQNAGGRYPPYGLSSYSDPGYGYGPATNGMAYGGYGNYGGGNSVYGAPSASGYRNPNAGYGGAPVNTSRSSWGSQAPSGYGNMSLGSSQWGSGGLGRGGIATVQSPSGASGYVNQSYGYENLGWQSDPIQGSDNFGQQSSGPNYGQVGYVSAPARPSQQQ
ncbi:heterogeneous nuclear ribonucleo 1-like [Olea europaea subsp. europaea]|uniref:Heterogeneous nuclear ribonucleo 1-like n=1 Tax=Olea europaea subsp. europaea TaxID=158383 RepID=A0A8S0STK7_OLEEU|nr:heterogeneous nuclear ribonucleo 1-like [Olea europaea subsp. europaea]